MYGKNRANPRRFAKHFAEITAPLILNKLRDLHLFAFLWVSVAGTDFDVVFVVIPVERRDEGSLFFLAVRRTSLK